MVVDEKPYSTPPAMFIEFFLKKLVGMLLPATPRWTTDATVRPEILTTHELMAWMVVAYLSGARDHSNLVLASSTHTPSLYLTHSPCRKALPENQRSTLLSAKTCKRAGRGVQG